MTAGLDGSRGLVVGSPTENMEGTVQTWLGNLLNEKSGGGAGDIAYNFVLNLLASQDMMDIAAKFRRRNNVPDPGTTIGIEQISQNILSTIASDELKRQSEGYRSLLLVGRVTDVASAEGIKSYNNFSIGSTKDIEINPNVKEGMAPLDSSKTFIEAIKSKYVKILHNETQGTKALTFTIEDANKTVNAIVSEDKNGNTIYDMPFVRPDLFYLLVEIYDRLKTEFLINGTYHDNQTKFLDHPLIIESALRAGENTWNSTGFVCRISVPGYDLEALLKTIYQEQMKINHPYFMYNKLDSGSFDILVFPPKSYDSLKPTVTGNKGAR
jgi:hypothetical protein